MSDMFCLDWKRSIPSVKCFNSISNLSQRVKNSRMLTKKACLTVTGVKSLFEEISFDLCSTRQVMKVRVQGRVTPTAPSRAFFRIFSSTHVKFRKFLQKKTLTFLWRLTWAFSLLIQSQSTHLEKRFSVKALKLLTSIIQSKWLFPLCTRNEMSQ